MVIWTKYLYWFSSNRSDSPPGFGGLVSSVNHRGVEQQEWNFLRLECISRALQTDVRTPPCHPERVREREEGVEAGGAAELQLWPAEQPLRQPAGVWGFGVWDWGFGVLGFGVWGLGLRVEG